MERPSPHLEGNRNPQAQRRHAGSVTSFVQNVLLSYDDVMHGGDAAERAKTRRRIPLR